jgi:tRNA A-37 threonylcarbamoyl transferase component Bud32
VATFLEEGAIDALALLEQRLSAKRVLRAAEAAGAALRRFHDAGGSHRDLQLKNLLLRELDARTECIVVDLDRARLQSEVAAADRMKQLMRLFRSLRKRGVLAAVGARGMARFFQAYVGEDRELRRALRRRLAWERLKVAIHALHYRQAQSHWQDSGDGFGGRA